MRIPTSGTLRQLLLLWESLTVRRLLFNRFVAILVVAIVLSSGVQAYASLNSDGHVHGRVVDQDGDPVANATVYIQRVNIRNQLGRVNVTTNETGYYEFTNQTRLLEFRIYAVKDGVGKSKVTRHHLYFRGQNVKIDIQIRGQEDE